MILISALQFGARVIDLLLHARRRLVATHFRSMRNAVLENVAHK